MGFIISHFKQIALLILLLTGLIVAVFLAQNQQLFKSKASAQGLTITSPSGEQVDFKQAGEEGSYFTTTAETVQFSIQDLEVLKK